MNKYKNLKKLMACSLTAAVIFSSASDISMAKTIKSQGATKYTATTPKKSTSSKKIKTTTTKKSTNKKTTTSKTKPAASTTVKITPAILDAKDRYTPNEQIKMYVTTSGTKLKVQYMVTLLCKDNKKTYNLTNGYTKGSYDAALKCLIPFSVKTAGNYDIIVTSRFKSGKKTYTGVAKKSFVVAEQINVASINLNDINLQLGDSYSLPKKVTVNMKDGSNKELDVVWNVNKVDTTKVGNLIFKGKINGYDKEVVLKVNINNAKIASVDNITDNINEGTAYTLPTTVKVKYDSGIIKEVPVKWDNSNVNTDNAATYTFEGIVEGYQGKAMLTLNVKPVMMVINSITSDNLKELKVVFNKKADIRTIKYDNFRVFKNNSMISSSVKLANDGVTATITPDYTNFDINGKYTLAIENVKDINGNILAKATRDIIVFDNTAPIPVNVKQTGPKNIAIEFSEPIKDNGNRVVEIKNGKNNVAFSSIFTGYNTNVINVTLDSNMTQNDQYDVNIRGFKDFAGLECTQKTFSFKYVQDITPIKASAEYGDSTYVCVKFNKPVTGLVKEDFYHTMATYVPLGIYSDANMKNSVNSSTLTDEVWVKFYEKNTRTGNPIPEGTQKLYVINKYGSNEIKDAYNNKFTTITTLSVDVKVDKNPPEVISLKQETESSFVVEFSKDVSFNMSNLDIVDSSGNKVYGYSVIGTGKRYNINFLKSMVGQNVSVNIKNVEDKEIVPNKMNLYNGSVTIVDKSPAKVLSINKKIVEGLEQSLYIAFNKPVSESALDPQNYAMQDPSTFNISGKFTESPSFFNSNTVVKLPITNEQKRLLELGHNIFISNIQDINGNLLPGQTVFNSKIINYDSQNNKPKVVKLEARDNKTLVVIFDQKLGRVDINSFLLNGATPESMNMDVDINGNTAVYLKCAKGREFENNFSSGTLKITVDAVNRVENIFGVPVESEKFTRNSTISIEDKIAAGVKIYKDKAQVKAYSVSSPGKIDTIVIEYEKDIDATKLSALSYNISGREIARVYTSADSSRSGGSKGRFVVIELKTDGVVEETGGLCYINQVLDLYDINGNKLPPAGEVMTTIDCAQPVVVQCALGELRKNDSKNIKFSEELSRSCKKDIENAITNALKERDSISFTWNGNTLLIINRGGSTLYPNGTIKGDLIDLEGNTKSDEKIWRE